MPATDKVSTASALAPLFGLHGVGLVASTASGKDTKALEAKLDAEKVNRKSPVDGAEVSAIDQLTDSIMQSAAGQPFNFSITANMERQEMAREAIRLMLIQGMMEESTDGAAEQKKPSRTAKAK